MYKIEKNNIEKSYEYQLGLKNNEEYEERVNKTFLAFANLLKATYPNVNIEAPRGREKSKHSLRNKIEKLEIERLCKLYAIGEITKDQKKNLYNLILNKIKITKKDLVIKLILEDIKSLKDIDKIMKEDIEEHIKTALLRIVNTKLEKENKKELQLEIDRKYGETAAIETKQLKNNLLHWEAIENINEEEIKKLHSPFEYLCVKDLRAFKIIIAGVPYDLQTNNKELKKLLKERENIPREKRFKHNDLCCIELSKDFANRLIQDEELLEKLNIQVLPDGYKHKEKQNGYIAEHIKFCYRDHPEYTFEFQIRAVYREDISRANGSAAHDKRSGKKREFPSTLNRSNFIKQLENVLPKYTILKPNKDEFILHKCRVEENMLEYFLGYVELDSKEYKKAMEYIKEEQIQKI